MLLRRVGAALAALMFLMACTTAGAQTVYTGNGLIVHPTAFTEKQGTLGLYVAAFDQYDANGTHNSYVPASLTYSPTDRVDVTGVIIYHDGHGVPKQILYGTAARYQIVPDTPSHPAVAIVAAYLPNNALQETASAVLSHKFGTRNSPFLIVHGGLKWGETSDGIGHPSDIGGFVGLEIPLVRGLHLVGETSTRYKFNATGASAVGLLWRPRRGPDITLGFANPGQGRTLGLFFGIGLPLGGLK